MYKRAECMHKKHGGALTAYVIIHLTVWAESIRGEIIRWKESLTTRADVIASIKVGVAPVSVRLRILEFTIFSSKGSIET